MVLLTVTLTAPSQLGNPKIHQYDFSLHRSEGSENLASTVETNILESKMQALVSVTDAAALSGTKTGISSDMFNTPSSKAVVTIRDGQGGNLAGGASLSSGTYIISVRARNSFGVGGWGHATFTYTASSGTFSFQTASSGSGPTVDVRQWSKNLYAYPQVCNGYMDGQAYWYDPTQVSGSFNATGTYLRFDNVKLDDCSNYCKKTGVSGCATATFLSSSGLSSVSTAADVYKHGENETGTCFVSKADPYGFNYGLAISGVADTEKNSLNNICMMPAFNLKNAPGMPEDTRATKPPTVQYPQKAFTDSRLDFGIKETEDLCKAACDSTPGCKMVTYATGWKGCFGADPSQANLVADPGSNTWVRTGGSGQDLVLHSGEAISFPRKEYGLGKTLEECKAACDADPANCDMAIWDHRWKADESAPANCYAINPNTSTMRDVMPFDGAYASNTTMFVRPSYTIA